jgi:transcriptional regulator with XRE-family HTH domain
MVGALVLEQKGTKIGSFIVARRSSLDLTQRELAKRLTSLGYKYEAAAIAHWESKTNWVTPPVQDEDFVRALATALETTPFTIMNEGGFLEGLDFPGSWENREIAALLEQATPDQRETILKILKGWLYK